MGDPTTSQGTRSASLLPVHLIPGLRHDPAVAALVPLPRVSLPDDLNGYQKHGSPDSFLAAMGGDAALDLGAA